MLNQAPSSENYSRKVLWLIAIASAIRLLLATQLELGIDEVYYWNFVLYPDWSYFDHPFMIGLLGRIFTLNHFLTNDFFLRLGPICLSALSTWMIFLVTRKIKDDRSGFVATLLFSGSVYCSILSGFSFIPDAPLVLFWLLALYKMADFLPASKIDVSHRKQILWFGALAGLAILSKYQGVFLWVGVFLYILVYNRNWFKEPTLYLSGAITAILLLPILLWNMDNNFISYNYHSDRVTPAWDFRADYFLTEIFGQVTYNNPIVYVLTLLALIAMVKRNDFILPGYARILWLQAAPLWIVFTSFSIFRSTLPHWTSPAFISLLVLTATYWSRQGAEKSFSWIKASGYLLVIALVAALWLINYSPLQLGKKGGVTNFGEDDFTQDLYGWSQVNEAFQRLSEQKERSGLMTPGAGLVTYKMFPAAHLDYYVAQPNGRKLFGIGPLNEIHMYAWINQWRGGLELGKDYYHVALSNLYKDPHKLFRRYFDAIEPMDTVAITRAGVPVRYVLFYKLKNYQGNFTDPLPKP